MDLAKLPKTSQKGKKRIGRGFGSGRGGHASTRGTKGQKARGKIGLFFQGTKLKKSLLRRLPLIRGKGKFKSQKATPVVVNLKYLSLFEKDEKVDLASLQAKGILPKTLPPALEVKILGEGEIKVPLIIALPISKSAREKVEKAGGQIVSGETPETKETPKTKKKESKKKSTKTKEK